MARRRLAILAGAHGSGVGAGGVGCVVGFLQQLFEVEAVVGLGANSKEID